MLIGDWLVDPRDDSLTRGAERVKLEPRTMRLLMRLAQTPGQVVSQDELLESVWSGVVVGTASVYQSMSQLRKVLGDSDDPPRYIETVARKGYRLVASVSRRRPTSVAAARPHELPHRRLRQRRRGKRAAWRWIAARGGLRLVVMLAFWRVRTAASRRRRRGPRSWCCRSSISPTARPNRPSATV